MNSDEPIPPPPSVSVLKPPRVRKGGWNRGPSQVTTRPPPPAPLIQPGPKKDDDSTGGDHEQRTG